MSDPFADRMDAFDEAQSQRNLTVRHEQEVLAAQANVAAARAPDLAAKALKASRATGIPAGAYDADYLKIFDTQTQQAAVAKIGVKYPKMATFLANPDNAAVAQDDYDNLGVMGKLWYGTKNLGGSLKAGFFTGTSGLYGAIETAAKAESEYNPVQWAQKRLFGQSVSGLIGEFAERQRRTGQAEAAYSRPKVSNYFARNLLQGVESTPITAIGVGASILTGNPATGALVMGGSVGGTESARALDAGLSPARAATYGASQGLIEFATEKLPASRLLADLAAKTPFATTFFHQIMSEVPGEQVATVLQDLNEWAALNPEKPFMDYVRERPSAAAETLIATLGGVGATTIVTRGAQVAADVTGKTINRFAASRKAQQEREFLDKVATDSQESKTRTRDPQAFESLIAALSADTDAENIYIPAEKVREYLQSSDWDSVEFWQEYDQEIADGTLSNGDVVVPISKAVAHLAGTPAWDALKGDMRLSPGGQSLNEAQETEASLPDEMNRLSDEVAGQMEADRVAAEPRQKLFDAALTKLHNAGQSLSEATKNATLVASRYATRATRLGREFTGNEFDHVTVNQVLPPNLAPVLARDPGKPLGEALRPIVAAMRGKAQPRSEKARSGPSLIEFIRSKGGIDDPGGDLDAIGFGKLKGISKKGQTKLIRKTRGDVLAKSGAGLLGSDGQVNSNSPDELAMRAWEAGYFPEFTERPSVNDLLEALAEGNSGRHRYVASNENLTDTDQLRMAAQDLYQLLDQAGLDPDTASDKDIAGAIQRYQEQASRGQSFDQEPESIAESQGYDTSKKWYHATASEDFEAFKPSADGELGPGIYLSDDPGMASPWAIGDGSRILPVWIKRGEIFPVEEYRARLSEIAQKLSSLGESAALDEDPPLIRAALSESVADIEARLNASANNPVSVNSWLQRAGYVGVSGGQIPGQIAVFDAKAVKSVNNRGTFDPLDPRILFQGFFGDPTSQDVRQMLERKAQERLQGKKAQKAPGSDGGLFDTRDTQADIEAQRSLFQDGPVATITGEEIAPDLNPENVIAETRRYYREKLQGSVASRDGFGDVKFSGKGWQKAKRGLPTDLIKAKLLPSAPAIIKSGRYDGREPVADTRRDGIVAFHHFTGLVLVGPELYETGVTVGEDATGKLFYNLNRDPAELLARSKKLQRSDLGKALGPLESDAGIAENHDEINIDARHFDQSYSDGPRGRVTFDNGTAVIDLFQQRDLSTFLHEMGHVGLEELQADAALDDAPQSLKDDWQAVQDWFAANGHPVVDDVIPVDAHELWARGFERYLLEGKAPSSALRKAFEAFRSWMLSIYHLADNLRSPISPEIRGVMDRLIATDQEISEAHEAQNLKALFDSVESAAKLGMNEAAYKDYVKSATEAKDEAFDRLLFKTMESVRRERTKAYQDEREGVAADVRASVDQRPMFRALAALRAKDGPKLTRQWLIDTYGEDILSQLPKGVPPIYKNDGVDADLIAETNGFSTGDEMVKALIGVEDRRAVLREGGDKRSALQSVIDEETDAIMAERYGDPLSDGSIQDEALALIHNDKQGELQATELRVLSSRTTDKTRATPYRIARQWAAEKIATGQVRDVASRAAIQRYLRAAAKAGRAAEHAYMAGDTDEAFRQKQAQMLNNALVAEAKTAADAIDVAVERMARLAKRRTIKSMDQDYLERIHDLLEKVDLKQRSQASIDRQGSFEAWRAEQEAKGHDIVTPPSFADTEGTTHWSRLSVENLLGLDETIKQIAHLGRMKQTLLDGKERAEFDAIVAEAQISVGMLPPKPPSDLMEPSRYDAIKSRVADMDASLLKMETVFDWLDGGNPNGVFNRIVFRPIADAQDREKAMLTDYTGRLTDLLKAVPKAQLKRWSEKVSIPELLNRETGNPWVMTRDQLISMALNMGNEGNIQRLTDGYGWDEATVSRVLNRELKAEDWQYVQGVWDTIETLWPEIAAMERRVNGIEPDKVEAVPLETEHGTLRGGYFPAVYDPRKSLDAEANAAKAGDIFENTYTKATTRSSSTKDRADKVKRPIHLSLGVINRHVGEVIHDITHREPIMQADKFLSSRRIMKAVDDTIGPEVRKQFRPWLQHIANEWALDRKGVAGWDSFAKKLRTNTSIVGMGFRVSTILMQVAGYSNSFERIGAKWVAPQLAKAVDPRAYRFVMERSSEVRNRMGTLERDINDNVKQLAGRTDLIANVRKFAFYGIGYMDRVVVIPTWLGAYNRGISEGMSEADAGYYADKAVRQSQGAGAAKDLSAVQRSNEWMRLATMFYSYQSAVYQRFRSLGRDIRTAGVRDIPGLMARSFWLVAVPPLLSELLAGRGPGDDEDWGMWAFQKMLAGLFGPIPIARDVVNAAQSGFGYAFTPAARAFETGLNVKRDVANIVEGDDTNRATRNVIELSGYSLGLPTGQIAAAAQFIVDVSEGDQSPETVGDWFEGLTKGKISEN